MALIRRSSLPIPDPTLIEQLPHPSPSILTTSTPASAVPSAGTTFGVTGALRGTGQLTRSSYTTPEGVVLPISTYMRDGVLTIRETEDVYSSVAAGGPLGTYITDKLIRTTTGQYISGKSFNATKGTHQAGDYIGGSFSGSQFKQILADPAKSNMFFNGSLTDEYYLQKGVSGNKIGTATYSAYVKGQTIEAQRLAKGTDQKVATIRARMEAKEPGSTQIGGTFGGRDLTKVYPLSKQVGLPKPGGYGLTQNLTASGYSGNKSKTYSLPQPKWNSSKGWHI